MKYKDYIKHMAEIRKLSTLSIEGISSPEDYSVQLLNNFSRIGELSLENRAILDEEIYPLLNSEELLSPSQITDLSDFEENLIDAENAENLDLPLAKMLGDKLLRDAETRGSLHYVIREMDREIESCYAMMNMVERIHAYPELYTYYRNRGLQIGDFFRSLRSKETFCTIEDAEDRELVLTDARYASVFYENYCGDPEANHRDLMELEKTLQIMDDPFYRELVPDYDWDYYRYRTLQYLAINTIYCNERGFNKDELEKIEAYTEELWALWSSDPEKYKEMDQESHIKLSLYLNRYLAGGIVADQYKEELLQLYRNRDNRSYDEGALVENVLIPTELLCLFQKQRLSQEHMAYIVSLYRNVMDYVFCMPNSGTFSFMLEFLTHFVERFIEIPGGITFEEMMLDIMAALHPPTYVHTQMVAHITECLCGHLIRLRPDLFAGICDCKTPEEAVAKSGQIRQFAFHAALCHDMGKVFVIDTIFVYGRNLLDLEFDIIKTHPEMGAQMIERYASTAKYADVVRGHHRWHDDSRGYPANFETSSSPLKTIIDLTMAADCMDAATDTIGRSYKKGKHIEDVIKEFEAGAGTQYAEWIVPLLQDPEVVEDITWLFSKGREILYRETYRLLRSVHEHGLAET